jgi:HPt (histidine-containing phosphotransfer) domain-containing protein
MVGKHYSTLLSVSSLGAVEDRIRRFQSGEKVLSLFDLELLHQNGSPIAVEARTRPITDKNGTTIGFQGVYRAIAKRAVVKKDNGTSTSVSAEATISTAMPWERPATQSNNEGQNQAPLPDGYSPLSRRTETSTTTSISENAEQPQHHGILSSEQSSGSLSTAQGVSSVSSSEPSPVSSPAPAFRIAASASRPSSPVTHAESSTPNSVPPQFTLATDRTKKEDRQVNVVPFSPTSPLGGGPSTPGSLKNSSPQTFNLNEALARVEGDRELLCEMAGVFLDEYPMLLVTMQDALSHGNAQTLTFAVHTLKGSVANFAATNAFEAALRLEKIARQGNLPQAKAALAELEAELIRLVPVLTSLKMEVAA